MPTKRAATTTKPKSRAARMKAAEAAATKATTKSATPAWRKPPPDLVAAFDEALPDDPCVERRKMFGHPCAFARGQLFCGLHQEDLMVRLGEAERARALALRGARPFAPMPGRVMREYVVLPPALYGQPSVLRRWLDRALEYALSLPEKPARARGWSGARAKVSAG